MNKKDYTRQHTVPACYLANFGVNGNKGRESLLYVYDVQDNKTGIDKVDNRPTSKNFYDVEELGEQKKLIEKFFGKIEGELATLLHDLLGSIAIDPQCRDTTSIQIDKENLAAQFAMLITRTQAFRENFNSFHGHIKDGFPYLNIPQLSKADLQHIHTSEILTFRMSNFYTNVFSDWHWCFIINHTSLPFFTSDNPVTKIIHGADMEAPISDASPEVTYFVPLSPTVAVEIFHKDILERDCSIFDVYKVENISPYNKEIIKNCTRFIFSNENFDALKRARDMIDGKD